MKRYILLSYTGEDASASVVAALGTVLKNAGVVSDNVHGVAMSESEVLSILTKYTNEPPKEISTVESACIYAKKRFGDYFDNGLKLTLSVGEAAINNPGDKVLINAIEVLSHGVSSRIATQYGITKDVVSVFKSINSSLKDV